MPFGDLSLNSDPLNDECERRRVLVFIGLRPYGLYLTPRCLPRGQVFTILIDGIGHALELDGVIARPVVEEAERALTHFIYVGTGGKLSLRLHSTPGIQGGCTLSLIRQECNMDQADALFTHTRVPESDNFATAPAVGAEHDPE